MIKTTNVFGLSGFAVWKSNGPCDCHEFSATTEAGSLLANSVSILVLPLSTTHVRIVKVSPVLTRLDNISIIANIEQWIVYFFMELQKEKYPFQVYLPNIALIFRQ